MNQNELAEALGISPSAVSKFKREGMPVHSLDAAEAWRSRHKRARMSMNQRPPRELSGASQASLPADASIAEVDRAYRRARLAREEALAAQEQLRARELAGELVRIVGFRDSMARRCIAARDSLLYLADRLAPQLAGMTDAAEIHHLLDMEMRRFLTLFANGEIGQDPERPEPPAAE